MMDDESSDRRFFLATVLPALLTSLIGGVCSRSMFGGRTGTVAVMVLLLSVGTLTLGRNFMFPTAEEMLKVAVLGSGLC